MESRDLCDYDPSGLICSEGQKSSTCLTPTQANTVRSIYSPLLDAEGSFVYPRMQPGGESTEAAFAMFNGQPFGSSDWWKYAIFNDSNWDPLTLSKEDFPLSSHLNLFNIETWEGDISAFQSRGGKLLHYHDQVDGIITSEKSPRYYEHVSQTMGLSPTELDEFDRFFRFSGMAHCFGGPGASNIGNGGFSPPASLEPEENVLMAMVRWVEKGIAPVSWSVLLLSTGRRALGSTTSVDTAAGLLAMCTRAGDAKDEDSWACVQ
ncbi:hypothetical protein ACHAQH_006751 [Verticillium albo-atrum]